MKCFVFILATLAGARAVVAAATSCALSEDFFMRHNVSADDSDEPGEVCGGSCCGRGAEARLAAALQRAAAARAAAATRPVAELLLSTHNTLQEHLTALSHQSQNKSAVLFAQVYRAQAARAHGPLAALYGEVRGALRPAPAPAPATAPLLADPPQDLAATTRNFFRDIFPLAYHNILRLDTKQFTADYEVCLKDAYDAVQPFGEVPQQLGATLSKSVAGARALLLALGAGAGALAGGERAVARAAAACAPRLLRAAGCARCRGLAARPCRHYCLNLARGCMGSAVAELEAPWAGFVEGAERLARGDADAALRALDSRLSLAIMHALENHVLLDKKVRQECGTPSTQEGAAAGAHLGAGAGAGAGAGSGAGAGRREALRAPPPDAELLQCAAALANTKRLFAALLDQLCDEPDFADDDNEQCWNGNTVGEYVKPLVASSSLSDQKYNPEIEGRAPQDPEVGALADRLRQARQLLMSNNWSNAPAAEAFMQGDEAGEAGEEGSGSGRNYAYDDGTFDAEGGSGEEGSGSPDGPGIGTHTREGPMESSTPKTGGGAAVRPAAALLAAALLPLLAVRAAATP